jgi:peptidoglycan/LPS O-acetylase OafA/YrhL
MVAAVSILGFISSVLLSEKDIGTGTFLVRRLTRIYIPLTLCLMTILIVHALVGKSVTGQHTILHLLGFTAFFKLFDVKSTSTIGHGLWFVTTIIIMYFLLPVLHYLFRRPAGLRNFLGVVVACTALNYSLAGTENIFTVVTTFSLGAYLGVNRRIEGLLSMSPVRFIFFGIVLFTLLSAMIWFFDAWHPLPQLVASLSPLAFVPLSFAVAAKLPPFLIAGTTLFAGLSYEFYILHFYFINEGFHELFKVNIGLLGHTIIAFTVVFLLSFVLSRIGSFLISRANLYLCGTGKESEEKFSNKKPDTPAVPVVKS